MLLVSTFFIAMPLHIELYQIRFLLHLIQLSFYPSFYVVIFQQI